MSPTFGDAGLRAYLDHPLTSVTSGDASSGAKETPSLLYDYNKFAVQTGAATSVSSSGGVCSAVASGLDVSSAAHEYSTGALKSQQNPTMVTVIR